MISENNWNINEENTNVLYDYDCNSIKLFIKYVRCKLQEKMHHLYEICNQRIIKQKSFSLILKYKKFYGNNFVNYWFRDNILYIYTFCLHNLFIK